MTICGTTNSSIRHFTQQSVDHEKQQLDQLYHCHNFFSHNDLSTLYESWVRPSIEYGYVLYSSAALSHLHCLVCA